MLVFILLLAMGLLLLIGGADFLIRGAAAVASALGLSSLAIGMTIVAFGTSMPEMVINTLAAAKGETGLAFGNIVGSCAINIGFVLALTALVRPLRVERSLVSREIPMMILAAIALVVLSADRVLNGTPADVLHRSDGLMLLLLFCVFLYYTTMGVLARRVADPFLKEVAKAVVSSEDIMPARRPLRATDFMWLLGGLGGVAIGGRMVVTGAVGVATSLDVPQVVIGFTLVSFGTTLPEVTTCLLAARRGQPEIALGNIVGSNIFNILFIGGLVASIRSVAIPVGGLRDVLVMSTLCVILLPVALRGPRMITRAEGAVLLSLYLVYLSYRWFTVH